MPPLTSAPFEALSANTTSANADLRPRLLAGTASCFFLIFSVFARRYESSSLTARWGCGDGYDKFVLSVGFFLLDDRCLYNFHHTPLDRRTSSRHSDSPFVMSSSLMVSPFPLTVPHSSHKPREKHINRTQYCGFSRTISTHDRINAFREITIEMPHPLKVNNLQVCYRKRLCHIVEHYSKSPIQNATSITITSVRIHFLKFSQKFRNPT